MLREFNVTGPPGTGKTTYLAKQVKRASAAYGANKVVVCSLTRTAAANIAGAVENFPRQNIGTLHSFAYRALPGADIAEAKLALFNAFCMENGQPMMKVAENAKTKVDPDEHIDDIVEVPITNDFPGDEGLRAMNILRAKMVSRQLWPEPVKAFANLWDRWKREAGVIDFTDLLEICLRDVEVCPGDPAALFVDEAQDFTRLAFRLVRKWGEKCISFITVGDADQALYNWAGAEVEAFYNVALPAEQRRVLAQSYRVPFEVHKVATAWIAQTPNRRPVNYRPRDFVGTVERSNASLFFPQNAIEDVKRQVDAGKTCMFLVSCAYMLQTTISHLRNAGLCFHNPYRTTRGDWNPLRAGATSPAARLAAFLRRSSEHRGAEWSEWSNHDIRLWSEWLPAKDYLFRGARTMIEEADKEKPGELVDVMNVCNGYFLYPHFEAINDASLDWWTSGVEAKHKEKLKYPLSILKGQGYKGLVETPKIIVSTIHGAKGGEADNVYVFPDISPNALREWQGGGDGREGVRRAFYVALTRARERLVICQASNKLSVNL